MSTRTRAFLTFEQSAARPLDVASLSASKLVAQSANNPLRDVRLIGPLTVPSGKAIDVPHGLGRPAVGLVLVLLPNDNVLPSISNASNQLSDAVRATHVRVSNSGGADETFSVLVF